MYFKNKNKIIFNFYASTLPTYKRSIGTIQKLNTEVIDSFEDVLFFIAFH